MATGDVTDVTVTEKKDGAFLGSLKRNNAKIRADRADAIGEDAQIVFRRRVEDLELEIKRTRRERENMLDLSPTNAFSLMVADDFDSALFVAKDIELGLQIRELGVTLEIAQKRYDYLFGGIE